jgi:hypothetical protein
MKKERYKGDVRIDRGRERRRDGKRQIERRGGGGRKRKEGGEYLCVRVRVKGMGQQI